MSRKRSVEPTEPPSKLNMIAAARAARFGEREFRAFDGGDGSMVEVAAFVERHRAHLVEAAAEGSNSAADLLARHAR